MSYNEGLAQVGDKVHWWGRAQKCEYTMSVESRSCPILTGDVFKRILTSMMEFFGKIAKDYYYYGVYFEKLLNV